MAAGRRTKYRPEYAEQAQKLAARGATDMDLADFFGVSDRTIRNWLAAHEAFHDAVRVGDRVADERVERSLYQRAVGYSFHSEEIRVQRDGSILRIPVVVHEPPNIAAASFWLRNRRPDAWRDRVDLTVKREVGAMSDAELEAIAAEGRVTGPPEDGGGEEG